MEPQYRIYDQLFHISNFMRFFAVFYWQAWGLLFLLFFVPICLSGKIGMFRSYHRHKGTKRSFLQYTAHTI